MVDARHEQSGEGVALLGRRSRLLLLLAFLPMFFLGLAILRFVRDDWSNLRWLEGMASRHAYFAAISDLVTNVWFGAHERRVFFLSWAVQFMAALASGHSQRLLYGMLLAFHFAGAVLIGAAVIRVTRDRFFAVAAALVALFVPTFTQGAFFLNNQFFVQPWFFLALLGYLLVAPRKGIWTDRACLWGCALACEFSGEAALFTLYALLGLAAIYAFRRGDRSATQKALRPLGAALISALALFVYLRFVMIVQAPQSALRFDFSACSTYLVELLRAFLQFYDLWSERYGIGGMTPKAMGVAATILSSLAAYALLRPDLDPGRPRPRLAILALFAAGLAASLALLLVGVVAGSRPGVETRYLYVSGELAGLTGVAILFAALGWNRILREYVLCPLLVLGLSWFMFLDYDNLVTIWGTQRQVDAAIWRTLDPMVTAEIKQVVTYNPNHAYLMAPYHSNAVSDFQADWGVAGRVYVTHHRQNISVGKNAKPVGGGMLDVTGYYGSHWLAREDQTLFVVYLYGPRFRDLESARLQVFTRYSDFDKYVSAIPQEFIFN